jgi:rhodanese-related sulfurtransferase
MDLNQLRQELDDQEAILLDVREQKEWDEGHLSRAQHLPLSKLNEKVIPLNLPKNKTIYTHCRKGGRAEQAAKILKEKYENVVPLKYSFDELKQELE